MWTGSTGKGVGGDREHSSAEGTPRHRADQAEPNRTAASELGQMTFSLVHSALSPAPKDGGIKSPKTFNIVPWVRLGRWKRGLSKGLAELSRRGCLPPLGRPRVTLCPEPLRHSTPSPNALVASSGCPACLTQTLRLPSQRPFLVA